jgi:hypothetical protein
MVNQYVHTHDSQIVSILSFYQDILSKHCGPYGRYAMVGVHDGFGTVKFTKDGINILKSLAPTKPIDGEYTAYRAKIDKDYYLTELLHTLICYVGHRVERYVGDGTTTAMLVAIGMLLYNHKADYQLAKQCDYSEANRVFYELMAKVEEEFNTSHKYTLDSLIKYFSEEVTEKELIRAIAYHQAYTSSHGDREIAQTVATLFEHLPKSSWEHVLYADSYKEEKDRLRFILETDQYQTESDILLTQDVYNVETGDAVKYDDCILAVLPNALNVGTLPANNFEKLFNDAVEQNRPLVCLVASMCPTMRSTIHNMVNAEYVKGKKVQFAVFTLEMPETIINDLMFISALFNPTVSKTDFNICESASVHYYKKKLRLNGLYTPAEGDDIVRPHINDPTQISVLALLQMMKDNIGNKKSKGTTSHAEDNTLRYYQMMYNRLLLDKRPTILIGGGIYENVALLDIVEDAVKAVRQTLLHGFSFAGSHIIIMILQKIKDQYVNSEVMCNLCDMFIDGYTQVYKAAFANAPNYDIEPTSGSIDLITGNTVTIDEVSRWVKEMEDCPMVIQPTNTDIEIMKRVNEAILKFMFTDSIITR